MSGSAPAANGTRFDLFDEIARGGMARVHLGRSRGAGGFARTVAIKRLHRSHGDDPELVAMLLDEARLVARVHHPNVVPIVDVVEQDGELLLAMEYVHGETLARLARACPNGRLPPAVAAAALVGALRGLHAAHEARDERGEPLCLVHRDVSPQNVMVGTDGVARVLDFGIAKAAQRSQITRQGHIKGKYAYMAPEQIRRGAIDRRTDVFAAAAVLWEALTGLPVFGGDNPAAVMTAVLGRPVEPPSRLVEGLPPSLDAVVLKGLERDPEARFASAREMAIALERAAPCASAVEVGAWVEAAAAEALAKRSKLIARAELATSLVGETPAPPSWAPPPGELPPAPAGATSGPITSPTIRPTSRPATAPPLVLSAPPTPPPARRRGLVAFVPASFLALGAFAVVAWGSPQSLRERVSKATQPISLGALRLKVAAPSSAAPLATSPPNAAPAASASAPAAAPNAHPSATASTTAVAPSALKPARPPSASPPPRPAPPPRSGPGRRPASGGDGAADSCTPPYTIEDGIRIVKPHCL